VRQVEQVLVVGVGVHGGHETADDVELVVDHLDHGTKQFVVHDAFEMTMSFSGRSPGR